MARFGGRRVFLAGLVLFVTGSVLASLAWSIGSLIAFRVVQGLGGGLLEPTSLALAGALAPRERVGKVLGRMSAIINVAPLLGPLVGSALLRTGHWQWIFLVNLPFGLLVLAVAVRALPAGRGDASAPASASEVGSSSPPPKPCTTRKAISDSTDQASAASAEPAMKSSRPARKTRRPPKRAIAQPSSGSIAAAASRYATVIQTTVDSCASKLVASGCRAAATTVPSMTARSAARPRATSAQRGVGGESACGAWVLVGLDASV